MFFAFCGEFSVKSFLFYLFELVIGYCIFAPELQI